MDAKTKHKIAREWLLFLSALVLGGTVFPASIMLMFAHELRLGAFYAALLSNRTGDQFSAWVALVAPYALLQVGRSLVWAYRTLRTREQ